MAVPTDGPTIRDIRRVLGLSQEDLASLVGVSVRTIKRAEHGGAGPSSRVVRAFLLERLARVRRVALSSPAARVGDGLL